MTDVNICEKCPLNREVGVILEHHERRLSKVELDVKEIRDFFIESRVLRQMTLGGGALSIITLVLTIYNLLNGRP